MDHMVVERARSIHVLEEVQVEVGTLRTWMIVLEEVREGAGSCLVAGTSFRQTILKEVQEVADMMEAVHSASAADS